MGADSYFDWRVKGLCFKLSPKQYDMMFFPKGRSIKKAQDFCRNCPVRSECLEFAIKTGSEGIWAGTNFRERQEEKNRRKPKLVIPKRRIIHRSSVVLI